MSQMTIAGEAWSPLPEVSARGLARFMLANSRTVRSGCLVWEGAVRDGVGWMAVDGQPRRVQVIAWELSRGIPVDYRQIKSTCGRGDCIRPDHLADVTPDAKVRRLVGQLHPGHVML